ncbi:unnamed protein product [Ectocarpus sp. CCAP 1310/34]|nr:unnamed protein product [Ectocarpus sp. CCAP 1310/34]
MILLQTLVVQIRQGTVRVKTFVSWWWPRLLSLVDASTLRLCKMAHGGGARSCQDMPLDSSTEVVRVEGKHGRTRKDGRFVFRVSTGTPRGLTNKRWELDAGSSADLDKWMSVLEGVTTRDTQKETDFFGDTTRAGDLGNSFKFSMELGPFTFARRPPSAATAFLSMTTRSSRVNSCRRHRSSIPLTWG